MINNQFSGNNMPFYGNNLNYNRNYKKEAQYDNLKQKSSGLGFFVFAYSLTMTVSAIIIVEVFKSFGSAKFIFTDSYAILNYFMDIFISVFAVVIPAFFYIKLARCNLNDIISTKYVKLKDMLPILFLGMGGAMIANVATSIVADNFSLFGIENTSSGLSIGDSSVLGIVLNIISTAIVPAFAEEFAFRGIVMGSLRKYGNTVAIIGSAVLFGAMHQNISQIPFAFLLGLIFAYIDCKFNSILPSIAIHFVNNLYAVSMSILRDANIVSDYVSTIISYSLIIFFCIAGFISYIALAKKNENIFKISDSESKNEITSELNLKEKMTAFLVNPGVLLSIVLFVLTTITNLGLISNG